MASKNELVEEEPLQANDTKKLEQALNEIKDVTGEFAKTFEGSEGQGKIGESNQPSEENSSRELSNEKGEPLMAKELSDMTDSIRISDHSPKISEEHEQALEKILRLLQSPDDTTKFMGLALLRGALKMIDKEDKQESFVAIAPKCWKAIPTNFLDRLFSQYTKMTEGNTDAKSMFELAIGVTHAYVCMLAISTNRDSNIFLPVNMSKELRASWLKRLEFMVTVLSRPSEQELHEPVIQVLQFFCMSPEGASVLLGIKDWAPLLRLSAEDTRPLQIFITMYSTLAKTKGGVELVPLATLRKSFNKNTKQAIVVFQAIDRPELLWASLNQILVAINKATEVIAVSNGLIPESSSVAEPKNPPSWFPTIARQLRRSPYIRQNERDVRAQAIMLANTLSTMYDPIRVAQLLFIPYSESENGPGIKPETYSFVSMLASEINNSILDYDKLSRESYKYMDETTRLNACYDQLATFIGYLVGREHMETSTYSVKPLLPPDLLLELRILISELMQTTIVTVRERFGPPGTTIRLRDPVEEAKWRFPWDIPYAVTCAQLQALALWLRDDDGEQPRNEAAAIMDVLLQLLEKGKELGLADKVMICLEGICQTSTGTKRFLALGGWQILADELKQIAAQPSANAIADEFFGEQIVIVLSTVVDQTGSSPPKATTMKVLQVIASVEQDSTGRSRLQLALLSLACLLLDQTAPVQRKQYAKIAEKILFKASALYHLGGPTKQEFYEIMMRLMEVVPVPGISM